MIELTKEEISKLLDDQKILVINGINNTAKSVNQINEVCGWNKDKREIGTRLCLVHSEVSEAMEGFRKNLMDDHLPHRKMAEVELADAVIRILHIAEEEGLDIGGALWEKLQYNLHRDDHKPENREKENGKAF